MTKQDKIAVIAVIGVVLSTISLILIRYYLIDDTFVPYTKHISPYVIAVKSPPERTLLASWYSYSLPDAQNYSQTHATAASRTIPRGTIITVCRVNFEHCVAVRINDFVENPKVELDLSDYAFEQLAPLSRGVIEVVIK